MFNMHLLFFSVNYYMRSNGKYKDESNLENILKEIMGYGLHITFEKLCFWQEFLQFLDAGHSLEGDDYGPWSSGSYFHAEYGNMICRSGESRVHC